MQTYKVHGAVESLLVEIFKLGRSQPMVHVGDEQEKISRPLYEKWILDRDIEPWKTIGFGCSRVIGPYTFSNCDISTETNTRMDEARIVPRWTSWIGRHPWRARNI